MTLTDKLPPGFTSWTDYATTHQHVGAKPCWQCNARKRALAEQEALERERDAMAAHLRWALKMLGRDVKGTQAEQAWEFLAALKQHEEDK